MHIGRVHTKTIKSTGPRKQTIDVPALREVEVIPLDDEPVLRRPERLLSAPDSETRFQVNACPHCFFPLAIMFDALDEEEIEHPGFCPGCTCPIQPIKTALRVSEKMAAMAHKIKRQLQPV